MEPNPRRCAVSRKRTPKGPSPKTSPGSVGPAGHGEPGCRPGPLILDPDMGLNSEHTVAEIKTWYAEAMA